jgi:hypothetical protein
LITGVLIGLNGFFSIAMFSVCYEYVALVSPRVGESISGGLINTTANFLGFIFIVLIDYLIDLLDKKGKS